MCTLLFPKTDSLFYNIATRYYETAQWDSAHFYFTEFTSTHNTKDDPILSIASLRNMGNSLIRLGSLDDAESKLLKSLEITKEYYGNVHQQLILSMNSLAVISSIKGDYEAANYIFLDIIKIQNSLDDSKHNLLGKLHNNVANNYNYLNKNQKALNNYLISLEHKKKAFGDNSPKLAITLNNIGTLYHEMANYDEAIEYFTFALKFKEINDDKTTLSKIYYNLGIANTQLRNYDIAESYLINASELNETKNKHFIYSALSDINRHLGEYEKAENNLEIALDIVQTNSQSDARHEANIYNYMGKLYFDKQDTLKAILYFEKSINKYNSMDILVRTITFPFLNISNAYFHSNPKKAIEYANKIIAVADSLFTLNNAVKIMGLNQRAKIELNINNFSLALDFYKQALNENINAENHLTGDSFIHTISRTSLIQSYVGIMKTHQALYQATQDDSHLFEIIKYSKNAIDVLNFIRDRVKFNDSKYLISQTYQDVFNITAATTYKLFEKTNNDKHFEYFFTLAEQSKNAVLKSVIKKLELNDFSGLGENIRENEDRLKREISSLETQLSTMDGDISSVKNELAARVLEFDHFLLDVKQNHPDYFQIKYDYEILPSKEIQYQLNDDELFLTFTSDSEFYYLVYISEIDKKIIKLATIDELNNIISTFKTSVKKVNKKQFIHWGYELFKKVFSKIESQINNYEKLYISSQGLISKIPFELLLTKNEIDKNSKYSDLPYLIHEVEINYVLGCDYFLSNKNNIEFNSILAFSPINSFSNAENFNLSNLPFSSNEVESINAISNKININSKIKKYNDASEYNFKLLINENFDVIHLSTHGILNEENPKFSALVLSNANKNEDGILYANELYNLDLNTNLIVLSSCESGEGKYISGEGILSLMQGVFYAGSENLIYTLWKIDDKNSAKLIEMFYSELLSKKLPISTSLRNAKIEMIKNSATAAPRHWGAFVHIAK
jgi:CHAT domain-containing protein/tetratricopeptide (TPR) repeat protein